MKQVTMFIPPAYDWSMPTMAFPLLKAFLPSSITSKIVDLNRLFMSSVFQNYQKDKSAFSVALNSNNMSEAIHCAVNLERTIFCEPISEFETVRTNRIKLNYLWEKSEDMEVLLTSGSATEDRIRILLDGIPFLTDNLAFCISISVEDQIFPSFVLMKILKERYKAPIILGGNIVTRQFMLLKKSRLKHLYDYLIYGEGEQILPQLLLAIESKNNVTFQDNVFCTESFVEQQLISSDIVPLDAIKIADFKDIELVDYLCPIPILPISLNRKCLWGRCDFCAIHCTWGNKHREKNIEDIITEVVSYINEYGVTHFRIIDEDVPPRILYEFANAILEKGITIFYEAYVRFDKGFIADGVIEKLYLSGCRQLFWGIENINSEALILMRKGTIQQNIKSILKLSASAGILNFGFILTGIPNISLESEEETINFILSNEYLHTVAIGTFVIDRLSPIHIDENTRKKYNVTIFEIGDLTTEVGYSYHGIIGNTGAKKRTKQYIKRLYKERPDLAVCSLLAEEIRFILACKFGNNFAKQFIAHCDDDNIKKICDEAIERAINERVIRGGFE
ncbi:hypothetical protein AGMMS50268_34300 [Spirochaetia bacterium]|nr:hypothetical protein AGMMS50268_34300 [Spirochaetia bacterium]